MEKFITPIKQNYYPACKSTSHREGDWICYNCNNLNFSFRKKCNRCKIQTRQQNDLAPVYSYYYYMQNPKQQSYQPNTKTPLTENKQKQQRNITTPPKQNKLIKPDLPSVSPLLKKYKASKLLHSQCKNQNQMLTKHSTEQNTILEKYLPNNFIKNNNNEDCQILNSVNQQSWKNIDVKDFQEFNQKYSNNIYKGEDDDQYNEELERLIGQVIM